MQYSGQINAGTVTLSIYKNSTSSTPLVTTLPTNSIIITNTSRSMSFSQGDIFYAKLVTSANPGPGYFMATLGFY